jgi:tetratricopeptide (TPR) repeat protein
MTRATGTALALGALLLGLSSPAPAAGPPRPPSRRPAAPAAAVNLNKSGARPVAAAPGRALPPVAKPAPRALTASSTSRVSDENRVRVEARLLAAREAYGRGQYPETVTALVKLLAEGPTTPSQLVAVYELLASAYVALGQTELAVRCFAELLTRRPDYALDPVRVSPKIRSALARARVESEDRAKDATRSDEGDAAARMAPAASGSAVPSGSGPGPGPDPRTEPRPDPGVEPRAEPRPDPRSGQTAKAPSRGPL